MLAKQREKLLRGYASAACRKILNAAKLQLVQPVLLAVSATPGVLVAAAL
jgi:hypothetical protein